MSFFCTCPGREFLFPEGQQLIAFADRDGFIDICNLHVSRIGSPENDSVPDNEIKTAKHNIKRLDRFWFRFWADVYPF